MLACAPLSSTVVISVFEMRPFMAGVTKFLKPCTLFKIIGAIFSELANAWLAAVADFSFPDAALEIVANSRSAFAEAAMGNFVASVDPHKNNID